MKNPVLVAGMIILLLAVVLVASYFLNQPEPTTTTGSSKQEGLTKLSAEKKGKIESCINQTRVSVLCSAIASNDKSLCATAHNKKGCEDAFVVVTAALRVRDARDKSNDKGDDKKPCTSFSDMIEKGLCVLLAEKNDKFCSGEGAGLCKALAHQDPEFCKSYSETRTKQECQDRALFAKAIMENSEQPCDSVSDTDISAACRVAIRKDKTVCEENKKEICSSMVAQEMT